jgi:hypothetical protein
MDLKSTTIFALLIFYSVYLEPAAEDENVPLNEDDLIDEAGSETIKITDESVVIDSESNWKKDYTIAHLFKFTISGIAIASTVGLIYSLKKIFN